MCIRDVLAFSGEEISHYIENGIPNVALQCQHGILFFLNLVFYKKQVSLAVIKERDQS